MTSTIRDRSSRHRGFTLLPGSPFHDAFFGSDDKFREDFDQDAAIAEFSTEKGRALVRERQSGGLKSGRTLFPRYGSF